MLIQALSVATKQITCTKQEYEIGRPQDIFLQVQALRRANPLITHDLYPNLYYLLDNE